MELFLLVDMVNKINRLSDGQIEIGTVETVGSIEDAYANITDEFPLQHLNLGLPRGVQGNTGAAGARGTKWFPGHGAPVTVVGSVAGDLYVDLDTGKIYELV